MKTLSQRLDEYLALRRSMGFDLSFDERVPRKFTTFGDENGFHRISTSLFLDWKANHGGADNNNWSHRLGTVRGFAFRLAEHDDHTEVPSSQLVIGRYRRRVPYIYAPVQITEIVAEAGRLPSPYGLRSALRLTLFGPIAVTGMRVNEALSLERHDVDLDRALLTLGNTENGRDRRLPINNDTAHPLAEYARKRDRPVTRDSSRFFIQEDGQHAKDCAARYNFAQVSKNLGIRSPQAFNRHGHGPRIHDLRHTFAVHTVLDWFRFGRDIEAEMYKLGTYLGHSEPKHTFRDIEAVPEPMQLAATRAEQRILEGTSRSQPIHCPSMFSASLQNVCRPKCKQARTRSPAIATRSGSCRDMRKRKQNRHRPIRMWLTSTPKRSGSS